MMAVVVILWCTTSILLVDGLSINKHSRSTKSNSITSKKANGGASKTFTFDIEAGGDNERKDYERMKHLLQRALDISFLRNKIQCALRSTFLPSGYPHTTPPNYLAYSAWSWAQDLTTQMRGVLATQRRGLSIDGWSDATNFVVTGVSRIRETPGTSTGLIGW